MISSRKIETLAIHELNGALLKCPYLSSFIDSNDRTPAWDGCVMVYDRPNEEKKKNMRGRVPVQVKGVHKSGDFDKGKTTFQVEVTDLERYYYDGGVIFFVVQVNVKKNEGAIFYLSLLPYELNQIIEQTKNQKTYTIHLKEFPRDDTDEMASIFFFFLTNKIKQMGIIGKEILSIPMLQGNGVKIERIHSQIQVVGKQKESIESYITTHEMYLYANIEGCNIDIPVGKAIGISTETEIDNKIRINGEVYYNSYTAIIKEGKPTCRLGKSTHVTCKEENKVEIVFEIKGNLTERMQDLKFIIAFLKTGEMYVGETSVSVSGENSKSLEYYSKQLAYCEDVKRMLQLLGVHEEMECDTLTDADEKRISSCLRVLLYGGKFKMKELNAEFAYGFLILSNLKILLNYKRQADGYYEAESFFNLHEKIPVKDLEGMTVEASPFVLLKDISFEHISNVNYEAMMGSIAQMDMSVEALFIETNSLLLRIIDDYDRCHNHKLLDFAEKVYTWMLERYPTIHEDLVMLNLLQIAKRKRDLTTDEILKLAALREEKWCLEVRCGAYILLSEYDNAKKCLEQMSYDVRDKFKKYPIYALMKR